MSLRRLSITILVAALSAYTVSRFAIVPHLRACLWRSHGHDFLATPVLLSASNLYISALRRPDLQLRRLIPILLLALSAGLFWEYVTPLYRHSTPDPTDLGVYLVGALCYRIALFFAAPPNINDTQL